MSSVMQLSKRLISNKSRALIRLEERFGAHHYHPVPVVINRGQGIYVYDVENKKYFDFLTGYSATNYGHCHPRLVDALSQQARVLHHTSRAVYSDSLGEFSEKLCTMMGYDKMLPLNIGVEAGELACKLARKWGYSTKKIPNDFAKIICAVDSFWGRSLAAVSSSTNSKHKKDYGPFMPGFQCVAYNDLSALELAINDQHVCAFMMEPIQGKAGIVVPDEGYLRGARELCDKYNVIWIGDEIQTGLGRTGKRLCSDYEHVKPHILILGKALAGGLYPVSAMLANDDIMMLLEPGSHESTFGGNPLGTAVATAALDLLVEENLAENSYKMGEMLRKELSITLSKDLVQCIRGKGLLNGIVINPNKANAWDVCVAMKEKGLLTRPTCEHVIRLSPPLIINEIEMLEAIDIIAKTMRKFE